MEWTNILLAFNFIIKPLFFFFVLFFFSNTMAKLIISGLLHKIKNFEIQAHVVA